MTEIERLPEAEKAAVLEFAASRAHAQLTTKELVELTKRMVETEDPARKEALTDEIVRGFYGDVPPLPNEGVVIPTW